MSQLIFERALAARRAQEAAVKRVAVDGCNPKWVCRHPVAEVTYPEFFNRMADDMELLAGESIEVHVAVTRAMVIDRVEIAASSKRVKAEVGSGTLAVVVGDQVTVTITNPLKSAVTVKAIDGVPYVALVDSIDVHDAAHRTLTDG